MLQENESDMFVIGVPSWWVERISTVGESFHSVALQGAVTKEAKSVVYFPKHLWEIHVFSNHMREGKREEGKGFAFKRDGCCKGELEQSFFSKKAATSRSCISCVSS